ncbi:MAG: Peptide deformylase [Chroococcopsis gigantea SAG 12.99]|jgi:peptide deformylase|nr:peptide deformylase [Chlorogloea purpurea SAG 13.99]MDV3000104.1 Peptide deformylase [Chroococcopsis gigantea SAG 12.99]
MLLTTLTCNESSQILPIACVGSEHLRQIAQPVEKITPQIEKLIGSMIATLESAHGVGIAAPQLCHGDRIFIVASRSTPRYPQAPLMTPTAMINPEIIATSDETAKDWEGCLSVPGRRGLVPRHRWIEVEYLDAAGQVQRKIFQDFIARIFQHELDHLDGIVFLDRIESSEDLYTEEEYQEIIQNDQNSNRP